MATKRRRRDPNLKEWRCDCGRLLMCLELQDGKIEVVCSKCGAKHVKEHKRAA